MTIARWLPGLATLNTYRASFLPHDLAAGQVCFPSVASAVVAVTSSALREQLSSA